MSDSSVNMLPKSWVADRLGNLVISEKGKKPKCLSDLQTEKFVYPYVDIAAFEKKRVDRYTDGDGCVLCQENDLLMVWDGSRSGYVGKAIQGALGSTLVRLNFPGLFMGFAYYFLQSKFLAINTRAKGTGTPHVDPHLLWNYIIPIPPLQEQHRIVNVIEELFSEIDNSIESLRLAQQKLRSYRQSVLHKAFSGELQDKKLEPKEILKIESLCEFITKGTTPSKENLFSNFGEIPFIKVYNLTFDGKLDFSIDPTFVLKETHNGFLARSKVYPGDVLMNIVGPPLGKVSLVPETYQEWNINQAIARFRCKEELYNKFIMYFLLSESTQRLIQKKSKATAGQRNLTLEICRDIEVPLFEFEDQIKIVEFIEKWLSIYGNLEISIIQSIKKAEILRQSILKKAFAGELVPQDPADEPAEKLLERIRAEKAALETTKKSSRRRKK